MTIDYNDKELERILLTKTKIDREYGRPLAKRIKERMAYLKSKKNLGQVATGKPYRLHSLKGKRKGQYAIDLDNKARLILKPSHIPIPIRDGEEMDLKCLKSVTEITILEILPFHNY